MVPIDVQFMASGKDHSVSSYHANSKACFGGF